MEMMSKNLRSHLGIDFRVIKVCLLDRRKILSSGVELDLAKPDTVALAIVAVKGRGMPRRFHPAHSLEHVRAKALAYGCESEYGGDVHAFSFRTGFE